MKKIDRLISMREFVLQTIEYCNMAEIEAMERYAKFLSQPLTLGMFIACDQDGNVLEKPHASDEDAGTEKEFLQREYNNAKDRVLFEGFEWNGSCAMYTKGSKFHYVDDENCELLNIENFMMAFCLELTLTETAIKQIYESK